MAKDSNPQAGSSGAAAGAEQPGSTDTAEDNVADRRIQPGHDNPPAASPPGAASPEQAGSDVSEPQPATEPVQAAQAQGVTGAAPAGEPGTAAGQPAPAAERDHPAGMTPGEHARSVYESGPGPDTTGDNLLGSATPDPAGDQRPEGYVGEWPPSSHAASGSANPAQPGQPAENFDAPAPEQDVPAKPAVDDAGQPQQ